MHDDESPALAARWGEPARHHAALRVAPPFFDIFAPAGHVGPTARAEVIFLVPRPGGILLHTKAHYPPGCFRLLTGTIERGESVASAIEREPLEELGIALPVRRYVARIEYALDGGALTHHWASHLFLLDYSEAPLAFGPDEEIAATRVVPLAALDAVADALEAMPDVGGWRDWGRYRAVAHRLAARLVADDEVVG